MFAALKRWFFAEYHNGKRYVTGGLLPHIEDERDFEYQALGGIFGGYEPKHSERYRIPTKYMKDQSPFNTCTWNAYASQRELDENVELSVPSIVCYGKKKNYLYGDGFASLRENQKTGLEFGIAEERFLPDVKMDWVSYSDPKRLTQAIEINAAEHKAKSYFLVKSKEEFLKALDDNRVIHTGADWFSGYNMNNGFTSPWILPWGKGVKVGGHAFLCVGYDLKRSLLIFQNSYGRGWGEGGDFYIKMADWFSGGWVGYVSVDLDTDVLSQFVTAYNGKQVKGDGPGIYVIQNGEKRSFPNPLVFYACGGRFGENKTWIQVSNSLLSKIPDGQPVDISETSIWPILREHWPTIQWLQEPYSYSMIDNIMKLL